MIGARIKRLNSHSYPCKMIRFFNEDSPYKLPQKQATRQWLNQQAGAEGFRVGDLNYVFCSDQHLLQLNRDYLQHDYYTDIITFDQSEEESLIEGDIFISVDRVGDNARLLNVELITEMRRVMAHGMLHLCGYGDKSPEDELVMRAKEDEWLQKFGQ